MENIKAYKMLVARRLFTSSTKQKIVTACKCPTNPAIYFKNRSIRKSIKVIVEKLSRTTKEPEPGKLPRKKSYRIIRSKSENSRSNNSSLT